MESCFDESCEYKTCSVNLLNKTLLVPSDPLKLWYKGGIMNLSLNNFHFSQNQTISIEPSSNNIWKFYCKNYSIHKSFNSPNQVSPHTKKYEKKHSKVWEETSHNKYFQNFDDLVLQNTHEASLLPEWLIKRATYTTGKTEKNDCLCSSKFLIVCHV